MNKKIFETLISDLNSSKIIGYGKSRVSGSIYTTYYMHSKSACMPGVKEKFSITPLSKSNAKNEYS